MGMVLAVLALFVLGFSLLTAAYNLLRLVRWALRRRDLWGLASAPDLQAKADRPPPAANGTRIGPQTCRIGRAAGGGTGAGEKDRLAPPKGRRC